MNKKPVVIITGGANGIGRATALKFAANGYALGLVDVDRAGLMKLKEKLEESGCDFLCIDGDLQDTDFCRDIIEIVGKKWGRVDVLINNAAWRTLETMRTISPEDWEKTLKINLTAPAFLSRYAAALMERSKLPGVIINVSSAMSQRAGGYSPAYLVCKGGIESLTYELAVLYGPKGIRVIAISPGNIDTSLSGDYRNGKGRDISPELVQHINDSTPLKRSGTPEEIADVTYWLSSKESAFITGTSILVDGGFFHNFNSYRMKKLQFPEEF